MFTIDPKITEKDLKKKRLFKVFLSMNNHQVATPETSLEEARSYVFFAREGRNRAIGIYRASFTPYRQETFLRAFREPIFRRCAAGCRGRGPRLCRGHGCDAGRGRFCEPVRYGTGQLDRGPEYLQSRKNIRRPRRWNSPHQTAPTVPVATVAAPVSARAPYYPCT